MRIAILLLLPFAAAQSSNCTSEIVTLAMAGSVPNDGNAVCTGLLAFEACISEIADPSIRSSLESELQLRQQQHADCRGGEPMTASIRTERDAIAFSGRDFTFHRTTRQALNPFELRDQVDVHTTNLEAQSNATAALAASISSMASTMDAENYMQATNLEAQSNATAALAASISSMASTMGVQATDLEAQSSATAALAVNLQGFATDLQGLGVNMSARFGAVANSIAAAQASRGCVEMGPYAEYDAGNGVCRRLNYTCDTYETDHYEYTPPTRTSDRVCRPKTRCNATEYTRRAGSAIENSVCVPGLGSTRAVPAASCLAIKEATGTAINSAPTGWYWIRFGSAVHQTFCHMTHEGGGWTMVGRGRGRDRSCG
jgi:hypothetical protein